MISSGTCGVFLSRVSTGWTVGNEDKMSFWREMMEDRGGALQFMREDVDGENEDFSLTRRCAV